MKLKLKIKRMKKENEPFNLRKDFKRKKKKGMLETNKSYFQSSEKD